MNHSLRNLESVIIDYATGYRGCQGVLLFSPTITGRDWKYSASRAIVYLDRLEEAGEFFAGLKEALAQAEVISIVEEEKLWLRVFSRGYEAFVRVDVSALAMLAGDLKAYSRPAEDWQRSVVYDPTGRIKEYLEQANEPDREAVALDIMHKIIGYGYEFLRYWTLQDLLRAYEQYAQFLAQVGGLVLIFTGKGRDASLHRRVLYHIRKKRDIKDRLASASSQMQYADLRQGFENALALVKDLVKADDKLQGLFSGFVQSVDRHFPPLPNFRDIAEIVNSCAGGQVMESGRIYRSALYDYYGTDYVGRIFSQRNIRTVITLLEDDFWQQAGTRPLVIEGVERIFVHVSYVPFDQTHEFVGSYDTYKNLYYGFLEYFPREIGDAFRSVVNGLDRGAVLIHCQSGKDRTGVLVALLLMAAGVDRKCIMEDYLASMWDTRPAALEYFFDLVDRHYGGINAYLHRAGVDDVIIEKLRKKLLV